MAPGAACAPIAATLSDHECICRSPQPSQHETDTKMHTDPDTGQFGISMLNDSVMELEMVDAEEPASQILGDSAMELWDFGKSTSHHAEPVDCHQDSHAKAVQALKDIQDFCNGEVSDQRHAQA